jgi:hypothetical protein
MQAQWLAKVAEGCAHARVGLTLRGAFGGGLSTGMLVHIMGYAFGGTQTHLQSCVSTGRVAAAKGLVMQPVAADAPVAAVGGAVSAQADGAVPAAKRAKVGGTGGGGQMQPPAQHDQEQLPPKLALVSHALALAATLAAQPVSSSSTTVLGVGARLQLQVVLTWLVAAAEAADCTTHWPSSGRQGTG